MSLTAFIFARGGSKGLPRKNIRPLAGKPLIGWAIEQALAVPAIGRVIVSTDDVEIAAVARDCGAQTPFLRPAELASDTAAEMLAWRHALQFLRDSEGAFPAPFISVPATAPLRLPQDIEACIDTYHRSKADVVLTVSPAHRSPWFNMVKRRADGDFSLVLEPSGSERVTRRQDAPEVFDIATVAYCVNPDYVMAHQNLFSGRVSASLVPSERSIDIDTLFDFELAEFLMEKRIGQR